MTVYWLIDLIIYIKKAFFANERQKNNVVIKNSTVILKIYK